MTEHLNPSRGAATQRAPGASAPLAKRRAFTLLEVQVAMLLLGLGVVTLGSLAATQGRVVRRLRGEFMPNATLYVTPSADPLVRKLGTPARISATALVQAAPSLPATLKSTVNVLSTEVDLNAESIVAVVDLVPLPKL